MGGDCETLPRNLRGPPSEGDATCRETDDTDPVFYLLPQTLEFGSTSVPKECSEERREVFKGDVHS